MVMAIWLIVKGFNPAAFERSPAEWDSAAKLADIAVSEA
jgi:hypothetical protein